MAEPFSAEHFRTIESSDKDRFDQRVNEALREGWFIRDFFVTARGSGNYFIMTLVRK